MEQIFTKKTKKRNQYAPDKNGVILVPRLPATDQLVGQAVRKDLPFHIARRPIRPEKDYLIILESLQL